MSPARFSAALVVAVGASPFTLRLAQTLEHQPSLCPLQRIVGVPCPSCGGTRACLYMLAGRPDLAIQRNALIACGVVAVALWRVAKVNRPIDSQFVNEVGFSWCNF